MCDLERLDQRWDYYTGFRDKTTVEQQVKFLRDDMGLGDLERYFRYWRTRGISHSGRRGPKGMTSGATSSPAAAGPASEREADIPETPSPRRPRLYNRRKEASVTVSRERDRGRP